MRAKILIFVFPALLAGAVLFVGSRAALAASPAERLTVGLKAYQDGFYSLAAKELAAFLEAAPEDSRRHEVLSLLAQAQIAQQDWDAARHALLELSASGGNQGDAARYWLGWVEQRRGNPREALTFLRDYLDGVSTEYRADALILAAAAALDSSQFERAAEHYARFLKEATGDARRAQALAGQVHALSKAGAPPGAMLAAVDGALQEVSDPDLFELVVTEGIRAARADHQHRVEASLWMAAAQRWTSAERRNQARFEAGMAWLRGGDAVAARRELEAFVAQKPGGPELAEAHARLAGLAQDRGDAPAVLKHLEAALALPADQRRGVDGVALRKGALAAALQMGGGRRAADHAAALLAAGAALTAQELGTVHDVLARQSVVADPAKAVHHWMAVPAESTRFRNARLAAAEQLVKQAQSGPALEALTPLLDAGHVDVAACQLALAAAEAAKLWDRAAELAGRLATDPPRGESGVEYLVRVAAYRQRAADSTGQQRALEVVWERFPQHPRAGGWAAAELQRLTFEQGAWEASLGWFDRLSAVAGSEVAPSARFLQAEAFSRLGRGEEAQLAYRQVAASESDLAGPALVHLATLLDRAGNWEEARTTYRHALEAGVADEVALWIRQRLEVVEQPAEAGDAPRK